MVLPVCAGTQAYPELPLQEMRIAAYTKAFAERFGLPAPPPGTEPSGGLQAIEFAIEKGPKWAPRYYCNFYLYVDSSLPIKYPEEGVAGEKYMLITTTHFFGRAYEQWMEWSLQDRRYSTGLDGKYNRKARMATKNYMPGKQGAISDLDYIEFHKNILPNLDYLKLNFSPFSLMINKVNNGVDIWVQQRGNTDYRSRIKSDSSDFIKFSIPEVVLQKIRQWGNQAKEANRKINAVIRDKSDQ
ncbi:hypothetical protein [Desulfuromusa kysingii]|uniref:hypothetical protein n=1 Tax=Desulfuromusa kysingii TaxID=37625 RepID=UPI00111455CF|nr:hypothetical protein [Desulfuromusa kysingii]